MARFRDATGRPGPSTWELGTYPGRAGRFPGARRELVRGRRLRGFAGKRLPTVHHWRWAARLGIFLGHPEPATSAGKGRWRSGPTGAREFGTYDMAGNVKEWCWNESATDATSSAADGTSPTIRFRGPDARSPFDRSEGNGIRCIMLAAGHDSRRRRSMSQISNVVRDYYGRSLSRRRVPDLSGSLRLRPVRSQGRRRVDRRQLGVWKQERISYAAAYGNERIVAYLYLPKNAAPPYQTVVYFRIRAASSFGRSNKRR